MRNKKLLFILLIILIAAIAVGCSSGGTKTAEKLSQKTNADNSEGQKITFPEERPALIGRVKEIIGNEVTVYKAKIPENPTTQKEQPANENQIQNPNQSNDGGKPANRGFRISFTEETETFMIPVGTPIVTMQRGTREVSQVGLTEIKKGTILRIWKKDGTVSFVQIMCGSGQTGSQQGEGGNRQGFAGPPGMGGRPPGMGGF
ncbi:MAG: hypothetical protein H0Z40_06215 [Desulfotomaculum sp.]|nr:hypothetical protein [Desulfotomaculum sp.]